jgi:hypothetical protein
MPIGQLPLAADPERIVAVLDADKKKYAVATPGRKASPTANEKGPEVSRWRTKQVWHAGTGGC